MKDAWWEIRNCDGDYVCRRGTKRECLELLAGHTPNGHWSYGPYSVWRMTAERKYTQRSLLSERQEQEKT